MTAAAQIEIDLLPDVRTLALDTVDRFRLQVGRTPGPGSEGWARQVLDHWCHDRGLQGADAERLWPEFRSAIYHDFDEELDRR